MVVLPYTISLERDFGTGIDSETSIFSNNFLHSTKLYFKLIFYNFKWLIILFFLLLAVFSS